MAAVSKTISQLPHIGSFADAAQQNAMIPLALATSGNARIGAADIAGYMNQLVLAALSGVAEQKDIDSLSDDLSWHTNNADIHIAPGERELWNGKQDTLVAGENITIDGNVISAACAGTEVEPAPGPPGADGADGYSIFAYGTSQSVSSISGISPDMKIGDFVINASGGTRSSILGVSNVEIGGIVRATAANAGAYAGNVRGPQGTQGETGATGPQGPQGATGPQGAAGGGSPFWSGSNTGGNCNTVTAPGNYSGNWTSNAPTGSAMWGSLLVLASDSGASYRQQVFIREGGTEMWFRGSPTATWNKLFVPSGAAGQLMQGDGTIRTAEYSAVSSNTDTRAMSEKYLYYLWTVTQNNQTLTISSNLYKTGEFFFVRIANSSRLTSGNFKITCAGVGGATTYTYNWNNCGLQTTWYRNALLMGLGGGTILLGWLDSPG